MGLRPQVAQLASWEGSKEGSSKKKRRKKSKDCSSGKSEGTSCWMKFRLMGGCVPSSSRDKVDTSISSAATQCESKSTNDGSRDQPVAPMASGSTTTSNAESNSSMSKVGEELKVATQLRKFTFNELKSATRNFRPESLLGEGGFGCVFKGWIEENGTAPVKPGTGLTVAVKTLNHDGLQGHKEWLAEVDYLGQLQHPNLVKLIGYCIEDDQRLLVYEFMPRGSLENHLFRRTLPLPWSVRMKIAFGAAKGLAFLHEEAERPVIYRDFKSSNVLLDVDYNAKLSDFGLAKDAPEGDKTHVSTRVMGTYGYAAPEYVMTGYILKGHLTSKSDVYSFGVVLLEMMTGKRSMDKNRPNGEHNLVEWARPHLGERRRFYKLVDPHLEGNFSIKGAQKVSQLAQACLSRDPKARPLMSEVVEALGPIINLKDLASSSYFYQTMQTERSMTHSNSLGARNGLKPQGSFGRQGQQPTRSLSQGSHASPYRRSPKPNSKTSERSEDIRVRIDKNSMKLLVRCMKPLAQTTVARVELDLDVPKDADVGQIRGGFEQGWLSLSMPKKRITQDPDRKEEEEMPKEKAENGETKKAESGERKKEEKLTPKEKAESGESKKKEEPMPKDEQKKSKEEEEGMPKEPDSPKEKIEKDKTEEKAKEGSLPEDKPTVGADNREQERKKQLDKAKSKNDTTEEAAPSMYGEKPKACRKRERGEGRWEGANWRNKIEEIEEYWLDGGLVDKLMKSFESKKKLIYAAAVGFSVGFFVAQKLRSRST
ncbi:hypothetical protein ZIOFF_002784 [Zingiber officinale]|uniref:non-specific serine/threonine protein kinase n=1 Tax=Zingiber officinale TaxID=94328 RepID=A0A8J5LT00_ZINOF|nr:hypothetical protein ZIOFF_002784 [Zingiber officinale]